MAIDKKNAEIILKGTFISIDPSCGSNNSMPAYAIYKESRLVRSGTIQLNLNKDTEYRLKDLSKQLSNIIPMDVDVAVIENIPVMPGKFSHKGLSSLFKSVGTIIGAFSVIENPNLIFINIMPISWRKYAPAGYVKSDVGDAILIGNAAIQLAKKILEPSKKRGK